MGNSFYIGIDPVIFRLGPVVVSWYVVMIALGAAVLLGWVVVQNRRRALLSPRNILLGALIALVSGVLFSKVLHVIDQWAYYRHFPGQIISAEGLTIWGALLGASLGLWAYGRTSRAFHFAALGDMLAPGIVLAQAVGRVGCTINGCCYGIESFSPLSVIYTNPHSFAPLGIPTLPITVFEIVYLLGLFALLLFLKSRLRPAGSLFLVYLALYGAWRLGIDFLRSGTPFLFGLHQAQIVGIIVLGLSVGIWLFNRRKSVSQAGA